MTQIDHIAAYVFFAFSLGYLLCITIIHKKDIWGAILGDDNKLHITEVAILLWLVLFPVLFFAEVFLGKEAGGHIWYSMDSIFLIIIGGNAISKKNGKDINNNSNNS